ncbi:MAG: hypothetical protein Q7J32_05400 [Sphingomonadaceae bacterium]|nr:hypothetical protein [Sphingomonadaceae bacterium]
MAGRLLPSELVLFFAEEPAFVTALVLVTLPATDWLTLLPRFSPTARSLLRNRRDLDAEVS